MAYAKSGNATEAYKQAGYNVKSDAAAAAHAARLVGNGKVQERLKQIRDEIASDAIMQPKEMQERLTAIARMEATETDYDVNGKPFKSKAGFKDALKAMELLGKMQGSFLTRKEIDISGAIPIVISDNVRE